MKTIASFDVFDTAVTRVVGAPPSVFLLLGRRLAHYGLIRCTPEAFARSRIQAEMRARSNTKKEEVTLQQIYRELGRALGLTPSQADQILGEECRIEAALLRPIPEMRDRILSARKRSRVAFLSDMYMPADFVAAQLRAHGLLAAEDHVLVSSEFGLSKLTGRLYDELMTRTGAGPDQVTHTGNDPVRDGVAALRAGLHAVPFDQGNLSRYESILEGHTWSTGGLSSLMAGACRLARLQTLAPSPHHEVVRDTAAGVAGPILTSYVIWLLRDADLAGISRLYFVSRDGQILLDIARRLAPRLGVRCELRYLYGSRQAWHLPGLADISDADLSWILEGASHVSPRAILKRVGLTPEGISEQLNAVRISRRYWDTDLGDSGAAAMRVILTSAQIRAQIIQTATAHRDRLIRYLRQEQIFEPGRWGIVDVGWRGRMQKSLVTVTSSAGASTPTGYYFGLGEAPADGPFGTFKPYLYNGRDKTGYCNVIPYVSTQVEMFCSANHGGVLGFREANGIVEPCLHDAHTERVRQWGLSVLQRTICNFVDNLHTDAELVDLSADMRTAVAELLAAFWRQPTKSEARAWGSYPFEDDQAGTYSAALAKEYNMREVLGCALSGRLPQRKPGNWGEASMMLTPWPARKLMGAARRAHKLKRLMPRFSLLQRSRGHRSNLEVG